MWWRVVVMGDYCNSRTAFSNFSNIVGKFFVAHHSRLTLRRSSSATMATWPCQLKTGATTLRQTLRPSISLVVSCRITLNADPLRDVIWPNSAARKRHAPGILSGRLRLILFVFYHYAFLEEEHQWWSRLDASAYKVHKWSANFNWIVRSFWDLFKYIISKKRHAAYVAQFGVSRFHLLNYE